MKYYSVNFECKTISLPDYFQSVRVGQRVVFTTENFIQIHSNQFLFPFQNFS